MKSLLILAVCLLVGIIILTCILLINKKPLLPYPSQNSIPLSAQNNTQEIHIAKQQQPTENCKKFPLAEGCGVAGTLINICSKQYPNYPLLSDMLITKDNPKSGMYEGTITHLDPNLHRITVMSKVKNNSFVFQGGSVNGALYDIHHNPINDFNILQTGEKAVVSFPCLQKTGVFKLNEFQLVQ